MRLDEKFRNESGSAYLTGIQALVRLPIDQMRRDRAAGLNTAAFISGYEGSPLGGYDMALARNRALLEEHRIHFVPGLNEDLAATAVLGSQIFHAMGDSKYDGVVGIWYGKGPGVDRSGDILRHANLAGTGKNCAALVLGGDDHASKSSTAPHQSDFSFYNFGIPILYPGNVQEILDFGLAAIAMSRHSGAWVALKLVTNVCDSGGSVCFDGRPPLVIPEGYEKRSDPRLVIPYTIGLEPEVNYRRLEAARAFCRLNRLNTSFGAPDRAWLGIATAGKSYYDLMQAFADMGLSREDLSALGIRVAHFGMTFPLESQFVSDFARGIETILVVEEKRSFLELQLREALYQSQEHPRILGKADDTGAPLFPSVFELDPEQIAKVVGPMILARKNIESVRYRLERIAEIAARERHAVEARTPTFCPGCPHTRSTMLLEGQVAGGGIGCHGMAAQFSRFSDSYKYLTHMGGEGAPWIGMAPFVNRAHIFQNIGDGTYFHSGSLAVQAAIAAGVNITYKILYNGAVAMTGGQDVYGALPVPDLTRKLAAEGVKKIVVLTDDLAKYAKHAKDFDVRDREELPETMRELAAIPGVTVMIYDQQCAAEKRRMRSRGKAMEPTVRLVIHEQVCEGCGDCVRESSCMSLQPVQTEFGQKTRIHQSSCNKDYSCALGDCPSFVTVKIKEGTGLRKKGPLRLPAVTVAPPREKTPMGERYSILSPGIGGTGVVTINALLATAAWIDGFSAITLDQTGLAQKGGAVLSSVVLSERPIEGSSKIGYGNADLLLGFDLLGAGAPDNLNRAHPSRTVAVVNTAETPTASSIRGLTILSGSRHVVQAIEAHTRPGRNVFVDATRVAEGLFASHLAVNIFLMGVAYQAGLIPLSETSIEEAIRLNGVEAERNVEAFTWGRKYYDDARYVEDLLTPPSAAVDVDPVELRVRELEGYQDRKYATRYRDFVERVAAREPALAEPVGRYLYKLMAYKDEYEVARLLTKPEFREELERQWERVESVSYNLRPPLLRAMGWKKKLKLGTWFRGPLTVLAHMKGVRGSAFDLFGYSAHRREERALIDWYRDLIEHVLAALTTENLPLAIEIAALPDQIRGYENVKKANIARVKLLAEANVAQMLTQEPLVHLLTRVVQ
ncbi:MAG: indolepyruvate ferredoxin oxidoreductase family protein [Acidobacteriota bacterium]|nr:indolepyruvate ferredoxin oxidoreductase family protein [Acidobacteriota bacterium]